MSKEENVKNHIARTERRYKNTTPKSRWGPLFSLGWRVALEWGAAVLAGYGVGYVTDLWMGTSPWGMIVFLLLGNIAGLLNIYRTYKQDIETF